VGLQLQLSLFLCFTWHYRSPYLMSQPRSGDNSRGRTHIPRAK
jgi:hypothetical protein